MDNANRTAKNGFTIVEVLIAVLLVTILGLMSVPMLDSYIPKYRANAAAKWLNTQMMLTRMKAISKNVAYTVEFVGGNPAAPSTITISDANGADVETITLGPTSTDASLTTLMLGRNQTEAVPESSNGSTTAFAAFGAGAVDELTFRPNGTTDFSGEFFIIPIKDKGAAGPEALENIFCVQISIGGLTRLSGYDPYAAAPASKWKDFR